MNGYPWVAGEKVNASDLNASTFGYKATGGSANAYTFATPHTSAPAYFEGMTIIGKANFSNTGSATIDVDGLGAKTLKKFKFSNKN